MRTVAKYCMIAAAWLLAIAVLFQSLSLVSILMFNRDHPATVFVENPWLVPVWFVSLATLVIAAILCRCLKYKGNWVLLPLILGAVGTALSFLVAITLQEGLPVQFNPYTGEEVGLDAWKLTYRHLTSVFAGLLTTVAAVLHLLENRDERIRREEKEYKSVFHLEENTLGLESEDLPTDKTDHKQKRNQK